MINKVEPKLSMPSESGDELNEKRKGVNPFLLLFTAACLAGIIAMFLPVPKQDDPIPVRDSVITHLFEDLFGFGTEYVPNTDPQKGWVSVLTPSGESTDIEKICDGTTMLYQTNHFSSEDSPSAATNHPECLP